MYVRLHTKVWYFIPILRDFGTGQKTASKLMKLYLKFLGFCTRTDWNRDFNKVMAVFLANAGLELAKRVLHNFVGVLALN